MRYAMSRPMHMGGLRFSAKEKRSVFRHRRANDASHLLDKHLINIFPATLKRVGAQVRKTPKTIYKSLG